MKKILALVWIFVVIMLTTNFVSAYSESLELQPGESLNRFVNLNKEDEVSGRITLIGKPINFSIFDPDGLVIVSYTISSSTDFRFTTSKTGDYTFYFENLSSMDVILVTLNYNIQHFIFGLPQEYVLVFIIVGLSLFAIVAFIAMSPKP